MTTAADGAIGCLSDSETTIDLLNNEAIASTIVKLLREHPNQPVTIGVHGDWGAGKSSVLEMIEAKLDGQKGVLCLKFNGWRLQGFEDAKISLLEGIVIGLLEKRPALTKATDTVKSVLRQIDWLKVAKKAGGLAFAAVTGIPSPGQIQSIIATIEGLVADPNIMTKENIEEALDSVRSLQKPQSESRNVPETVGEFRKAFTELLNAAEVEQLIVLIDDLDRCLPDTAIETLEAVRLFLFTSRTAFVVAADEAMIEYAVRKHFPDLPDTTGPQTYARNYLEKLIQVPFRIPALGDAETRTYVTLLLVGTELGDDDAGFQKLINVARERLQRPWMGKTLDSAAVRDALGDKASSAQSALTLSDQIGPILASGTRGNPRQIKRFLNALVLRQRTAEARGFGNEVKLPVLAKLMLAERFIPSLFEQIATSAAADVSGVCPDLAALESKVVDKTTTAGQGFGEPVGSPKPRDDGRGTATVKTDKVAASARLEEWLSSQAIRSWAAIQPALGEVDLRPYLFIAKDRKDYFGAISVIGHLAEVAERLMGPRIAVQSLEAELKQLALPEATHVFTAVRGRIVGGDTFDTEPSGIAGLSILVRAHPQLQSNLLDLLEGLPANRLGPWAVKGWENVITDEQAKGRLKRLFETWASTADNPMLKAAAASVKRLPKRGR